MRQSARLAWVAGRQHRTALIAVCGLYCTAALLLAVNGWQMRDTYQQLGLPGCAVPPTTVNCLAGDLLFRRDYNVWLYVIPLLLLVIPGLAGAFAGSPVLGHDLDRGTFRFAWTQRAGRTRLLVAKLTVLGGVLLLGSAGIAALTTWWFAPLYARGSGRLAPQLFVPLGPAFVAWTLLAFALGTAAGAVVRRVVPAIAVTLAGYAGLALPAGVVLRYRLYRAPVEVGASLGQTSLELPPRSVPTGTWWTGTGGQVLPESAVAHAITTISSTAGLVRWLAQHDARLMVSYQPDSRYWPFQWTETAWLLMLTGLLIAAAFVLARPRVSRAALACLVAGAVVLASAIVSPALASTAHPAPPAAPASSAAQGSAANEPGYLALGDSVAFGYRPSSVTPAADYLNAANFTGYPEDIAQALKLHLVNASCPGETTSSMISMTGPGNGCETSTSGGPGYRAALPLHTNYQGSQLSFAVSYLEQHPHTSLVTIDIGANDGFRCQQISAGCTGSALGTLLTTVRRNLGTILDALRNRAHYTGTLVVPTCYALSYADRAGVSQTEALNATLSGTAARYGAKVADGFAAFRTASASHHGNACAAGLEIKLPSGGCDEHLSPAGQQLLAAVIEHTIAR